VNATLPQLILLDWMLPDTPGLSFARKLRSESRTMAVPIILLTGRDGESDKITGLEAGADDYLIKPFDFQELLARLRALLRRRPLLENPVLEIADLRVDTHQQRVSRGGATINLTTREYSLLEYLVMRRGAVVGRAEISEHVWDETYDPLSNLIEVYVQRLRRKIDQGFPVRLIHTRRGEGYQLTTEEVPGV
jgi:two-component system copper resistance phosphate regulon response regulator CusR